MILFFIFFRIVDFTRYIDIESKFSGLKQPTGQNSAKSDYELKITNIGNSNMIITKRKFARKQLFIYESDKNLDQNTVFIDNLLRSDLNLLHQLIQTNFIVQNSLEETTKFIITQNSTFLRENYNQIQINSSVFSKLDLVNTYAYVTGDRYYNYFGELRFQILIKKFAFWITATTILILIILKINAHRALCPNCDSKFTIWFVNHSGRNISSPGKQIYSTRSTIKELIQKARLKNKIQTTYVHQIYSHKHISLFKLHVVPLSRYIFMVVEWEESFVEEKSPPDQTITGGILRIDDYEDPIKVNVNIRTDEKDEVYLDIPFNTDDQECRLKLKANGKSLPYGIYALQETYINLLHANLFRLGLNLQVTQTAFVDYVKRIFYSLSYEVLVLYMANGDVLEPIVSLKRDENSDDIFEITNKWSQKMYPNSFGNEFVKENVGNIRFCMSSLKGEPYYYAMTMGYNAGTLINHSAETRFHFLIGIVTAFNHSLLQNKDKVMALPRIYELIDNTPELSLISCIGQPDNILYVRTTLRNEGRHPWAKQSKQTKIHSLNEFDWANKVIKYANAMNIYDKPNNNGFTKMTQYVIHIPTNSTIDMYSITSSSYFDDSINENVYLYLVEDVKYLEKPENISKMIPSILLASMLGLHTISKEDLRICDSYRLATELGYDPKKVATLHDVTNHSELANLPTTKSIQLTRANGRSRRFFSISDKEHDFFFIFPAPDVSPIVVSDDEQLVEWKGPNDLAIFIYNQETGRIIDTNNLSSDLEHFAYQRIFDADRKNFLEHLKNPESLSDVTQKTLRVYTADGFAWRIVKTSPHPYFKNIYLISSWALLNFSLIDAISYDFADTTAATFTSAKIHQWMFENAVEPVRIFRSMPRGQNMLIFNWTTIENNVHREFKTMTAHAISKCLSGNYVLDLVVPLFFEDVRWFLLRGSFDKSRGHIIGIAYDLANLMMPKRITRGDDLSFPDMSKLTAAIGRAKEVLDEENCSIVSVAELGL